MIWYNKEGTESNIVQVMYEWCIYDLYRQRVRLRASIPQVRLANDFLSYPCKIDCLKGNSRWQQNAVHKKKIPFVWVALIVRYPKSSYTLNKLINKKLIEHKSLALSRHRKMNEVDDVGMALQRGIVLPAYFNGGDRGKLDSGQE